MPLLTLVVFSAVGGVFILWIFKLTSNQRALKATRRRVRAYLLAMRLFGDDPVVILHSQGKLLWWNLRYMALLVPPFLVMAVPLYFAWDSLDALWGRAPLSPGETTVITAGLRGDVSGVRLLVPDWLAVESPAVHVTPNREVSWRVRVLRPGSGELTVRAGDENASRRIEARPGMHYLGERTKVNGNVAWLEVRYPPASFNWVIWFCVISTVAALAVRSRLRVTL